MEQNKQNESKGLIIWQIYFLVGGVSGISFENGTGSCSVYVIADRHYLSP